MTRSRAAAFAAFAFASGTLISAALAGAGGPPDPVVIAAQLPDGDEAAEHWDLAAHFEGGERLYVRFLITNAGPGDRTALAFGYLLRPGHDPVEFRNGRREGSWKLSGDRRRIRIGSSRLELGETTRHFEVDNDKRGIKIHLDFPADGSARSTPELLGGYHVALLNLATPASGRIWLSGMSEPRPVSGHAVLTHTWFSRSDAKLVARRIDVASFDPQARLFLTAMSAPDGRRLAWGVAGTDAEIAPLADLALDPQAAKAGDYPVPAQIEVRGKSIDGSISLAKTRHKIDPLDALPTFIRMVYAFRLRPRLLWVQADANLALKSAGGKSVLRWRSEGVASLMFPDVLPPDVASIRPAPPP